MSTEIQAVISLEQAQQLVSHLEKDEVELANKLISDLYGKDADALFEKVGRLTRELHSALGDLRGQKSPDGNSSSAAANAEEHLNYVIELTDKAANKTMDAVESCMPVADRLNDSISEMMPNWKSFMGRDLDIKSFKELCHQVDKFLKSTEQDSDELRTKLTDILMAQDFQDLTGQVLRRMITLIQDVENNLVDILRMFGETEVQRNETRKSDEADVVAEGPIINAAEREDAVSNQDDVDDLLSSLGF